MTKRIFQGVFWIGVYLLSHPCAIVYFVGWTATCRARILARSFGGLRILWLVDGGAAICSNRPI